MRYPAEWNRIARDVVCDDNRRQGISVISADSLIIEGCLLINTSGTDPQAGIDWEPNNAGERLTNSIMRNTRCEANAKASCEFWLDPLDASSIPVSVTVSNCNLLTKNSFVSLPTAVVRGALS